MPLGISQNLIERAYAPTDWSGFYNEVDSAIKKSEAIAAAKSKLLQKEYYTEFNDIKKLNTGILPADRDEILNAINEWKSNESILVNNPNLINIDREKYNIVKAKASKGNSDARALIEQSKNDASMFSELSKAYFKDSEDFVDNFKEEFKKSKETPISKRKELNLSDPFRFMYREPDIKNIDSDSDKLIEKAKFDFFEQMGISKDGKTPYGNAGTALNPVNVITGMNTFVSTLKPKNVSAYMKVAIENGETKRIHNLYTKMYGSSKEMYKNYKIGDKAAFPEDLSTGSRLPDMVEVNGKTPADLAIYLTEKKLVENQPKITKYGVERITGSKTDIELEKEKAKEERGMKRSKELIMLRESLGNKAKDIDDSTLMPISSIFESIEKGDVAGANEKLSILPNDFTNSYWKPGMFIKGNEIPYSSIAKKLGIKIDEMSLGKQTEEFDKIKQMSPSELSKKLKITESNLNKGLILIEGKDGDKTVVNTYPITENGKIKFTIYNRDAFGPKGKAGVLKSLGKEMSGKQINSILQEEEKGWAD